MEDIEYTDGAGVIATRIASLDCTVLNQKVEPSLKDDGLFMITDGETKHNAVRLSRGKTELTVKRIVTTAVFESANRNQAPSRHTKAYRNRVMYLRRRCM